MKIRDLLNLNGKKMEEQRLDRISSYSDTYQFPLFLECHAVSEHSVDFLCVPAHLLAIILDSMIVSNIIILIQS